MTTESANPLGADDIFSEILNPTETQQPEDEAEAEDTSTDDTQSEQADDAETEKDAAKEDGEAEEEISEEEKQLGYLRDADYRKKTQAVAEERRALTEKSKQVDEYLTRLKTVVDVDLEVLDSPEMLELRKTDPDEFLEREAAIKERKKLFDELSKKREAEYAERYKELCKEQQQLLFQEIPDWLDEKKRQTEVADIVTTLKAAKFSIDEINSTADHRVFVIARKAALYDKLKAVSAKKLKDIPRTVKPGTTAQKPKPEKSLTDLFY